MVAAEKLVSSFLDLPDPSDVVIACAQPLRFSDVCLACLHADGRLELLTDACESLLGYEPHELDGRPLGSLIESGALRRLLDAGEPDPVRIDVIVKGGARCTLRVHRRRDDYEPSLYLACEPLEARGPEISLASRTFPALSRP
jgi:hypothetical protein